MKRIELLSKDFNLTGHLQKESPDGRMFETKFHGQSILSTKERIEQRQGNALVERTIQMSEKTDLILSQHGDRCGKLEEKETN